MKFLFAAMRCKPICVQLDITMQCQAVVEHWESLHCN